MRVTPFPLLRDDLQRIFGKPLRNQVIAAQNEDNLAGI